MPGFGNYFVAIALFFFAFTTIVAYYYIAETNIAFVNRKINRPWLTFLLKIALMAATVYGTVKTADLAWGLGDIGVGLMAWLNIGAILMLQKAGFRLSERLRGTAGQGSGSRVPPGKARHQERGLLD